MKTKSTLLMVAMLFLALPVFSQLATNVTEVPVEVTEGDEAIKTFLTKYTWLKLFLPPLIVGFVMVVKQLIPKIPIQLWPYVTPFIGVGLDYLGEKAGIWSNNMAVGAAIGGLATWFHQIVSQTKELNDTGPTPSSVKKKS